MRSGRPCGTRNSVVSLSVCIIMPLSCNTARPAPPRSNRPTSPRRCFVERRGSAAGLGVVAVLRLRVFFVRYVFFIFYFELRCGFCFCSFCSCVLRVQVGSGVRGTAHKLERKCNIYRYTSAPCMLHDSPRPRPIPPPPFLPNAFWWFD